MSNPDIRMDVKIVFLWIKILSQTSNSFRRISIFLDLHLRIEFLNIPNLEFKFIWYKPLNHLPNFYLWESSNTFIQIQISFWIHSNQPLKIRNSNSCSFSTFGLVCDAAHPSLPPPCRASPSKKTTHPALWPNTGPVGRLPPWASNSHHRRPTSLCHAHPPLATPGTWELRRHDASSTSPPATEATPSFPILKPKFEEPLTPHRCPHHLPRRTASLPLSPTYKRSPPPP
jgi:hypothetical protein